jgi:hypothetical protein
VQSLHVTGFPTVFLQVSETKFYLLSRGYTDYTTLKNKYRKEPCNWPNDRLRLTCISLKRATGPIIHINMEYNKIIAVTGLPGLYELLSSKSDGAIVRSLDDKTTRFVASRIHNFSHLESIEVYTVRDNVNLVDILKGDGSQRRQAAG